MKVFISWSGQISHEVALALREWLPAVINTVEPFVSSKDIDPGTRWQMEVAGQLETTNYGLICVTRDNQTAAWLNFEAGALAKVVASGRVVPIAIDLKPSDIKVPLGQFQAQPASEQGIMEVMAAINSACDSPLTDELLERSFRKWWSDLETSLTSIRERPAVSTRGETSERSQQDLIEEVLNTVRSLARQRGRNLMTDDTLAERLPADHPLVMQLHKLLTGHTYEILHAPNSRMLGIATDGELDHELKDEIRTVADVYAVAIKYFPGDQSRRRPTTTGS